MKEKLITCFQDTLQISEEKLKENTITSVKSNKIYMENFISKKSHKDERAIISVHSETTFEIAKKYHQFGKVAVLNFANPEYPGGGVCNGAMAQEECLCRSSNLYLCLNNENVFKEYYGYHRDIKNYFYTDRLIYTKDITVFKNDDDVPQLMEEEEWFNVDVITCAAPFLGKRKYTNKKALKALFKGRIRNIFEAAIDNDVDVLILGAFGCGAFKNPPEIVAEAFYEVIIENSYEKSFKQIIFAIKSTNGDNPFAPCPNILAFEMAFFWNATDSRIDVNIMTSEFGKLRWGDNYPIAQAVGSVELPSGRILKGGKEFNPFYEWRDKNKYYGKQFSILGDSISTLDGYNPQGYKVFYYGDNCKKSNIEEYKDTWWGEVLEFFGGELLVNNSWSGSRVTKLPNQEELFPSGCSNERTSMLHINSIKPDVIIVNLGTNDWAFGAKTGKETHNFLDVMSEYFEIAYEVMLNKIKLNYPKSEVWCCTLSETFISNKPEFVFPNNYGGIYIEEYNETIRRVAKHQDCKLIDLYNMKMPYDSIDGIHPNKKGMQNIAAAVCYAMSDDEGKGFLLLDKNDNTLLYDINLSYGDFPIHNVKIIYGSKIIYKNSIHGSRDGGRIYPTNFFEEKEIVLNIMQKNRLDTIVKNLKLEVKKEKNVQVILDKAPEDKYEIKVYDNRWYDIKNPKMLVDFCEQICDFIQYGHKVMPLPIDIHDFTIAQQYTGGIKFDCEKYGFEKHKLILNVPSKKDVNNTFSIVNDQEYVYVDPNITTILYDGTISLTDEYTGKEIKIKNAQFDVGRDRHCILRLERNTISGIHASFFYEKNNWFIRDNNSTNGTRINGVQIEPNKKYQLLADDVIEFAEKYKYVFYKTKAKNETSLNLKMQIKAVAEECLIGKLIGNKYLLQEVISNGGMTKVYLATDSYDKKYVIKSICKKNITYESYYYGLLRGVSLLNKIEHPYIRKIVEQIEDENYIYIVMEHIEGIDLRNMLSKWGGRLPVNRVIRYAGQIAEALRFIHSFNPPIINRDIKPSNILIDINDNVKLLDFDIAIENNLHKEYGCIYGTLGYASPEQYTGKTSTRSDIFSLGMTMHHLLTGVDPQKPPYEARPICEINPTLPKGLEYIVSKCIERDPNNRYQSVDELINDLNNYMNLPNKKSIFGKLFGK